MGYKEDFINLVAPYIVDQCDRRGYKVPSAIIAQAICESNWGKSSLSSKYYNYFGMKCGSKWKGASVNMQTKEEYTVGTLTTIKDNFRAYANTRAGVEGYFDFINTSRYANLKNAKTPHEYFTMLKADGYATSSTYISTLDSIVKSNNLTRFDSAESLPRVQLLNTMNCRKTPDGAILKTIPKGTILQFDNTASLATSKWLHVSDGWICANNSKTTYVRYL